MRIAHVLNHTERLNGHVHAAVDLACAQAALGHEVSVVSRGGSFDALLKANGVETIQIDQRRRPLVALTAAVELTKLMRRFDIAHAHMMTSALLCYPACKIAGVPLVTTVHNAFERSSIAMAVGTRVIAVSAAVARLMKERGVPASRLRVVLNGTIGSRRHADLSEPPIALGSPSILSVGGLHPRKGIPDLLKAFEIVNATIHGARLHIVGEGPYGAQYRSIAAAMPCASSITFHGPQEDPRPWFKGADVFVFPSHAEPAGLVLSEACEAGCAIVASNVDGIPEMLDDGRAGILVPPKNPALLAKALIELLTTPNALAEGKKHALANRYRMSLDRVVRETLDVYNECLPAYVPGAVKV
ncbi:glycosyltransferase family 4 protein [Microvirga tunisiensis]|uniref:Glycosyltransferase family 4 protein n=1 Tax=Microvirga tunisiensis TaxID=2108360 RepID=A0A5N7MTG3_9HYPH|nr:glycosyltransferase family 4 protein [Microvirga tunisiensis]MPR11735.1 glycosyltransferase family 4 protein [Microvirga tunisiensis]MPR30263.1 glycosyltransferase family 4 protein [Microvirga tunisiensis]